MSFSAQIAGFGVKAVGKIQAVRRGVTLKLLSAVVLDTPVKTGRARGNWQVSTQAPITTSTSREDKSGQGPIREIEATVKESTGDQPVFLSNNLPYIERLENGSSKQAPAGMVRKNVVRFAQLITVEVKGR